jgi:CheY-like chemotaxis protein
MHLSQRRCCQVKALRAVRYRPMRLERVAVPTLRMRMLVLVLLVVGLLDISVRRLSGGLAVVFRHAPQTTTMVYAMTFAGNTLPTRTASGDNSFMIRPCFLVIDVEYSGSISTRKLVIETAKFNVITAYSGREALDTFALFPNITGLVMDANMRDISCCDLVAHFKKVRPEIPIVVISGPTHHRCAGTDHFIPSFDPARLLEALKTLVPAEAAAIEAQNEKLSAEEDK